LIGIVPLVLSGYLPWLAWVALAFDGLLIAFVIADQLITPEAGDVFSVERLVEDKLSLGGENRVVLVARYVGDTRERFGATARRLTVRDEPPAAFDVTGDTTAVALLSATAREQHFAYHVNPPAKGDFQFGDIFIRYEGQFGLIQRVSKITAAVGVKVYPNLVETAKYDMLARKGRLMQVGIRNIRLRGGGSEFESLREYVPGDEYRKIDWSATARRNKLISRQYQAERAQNILLVIDAGRTMLQPVNKMAKLDYVINTALMLAYVAGTSDDKVGLLVFDGDVRTYIPPAKGKTQVYNLLDALYNVNAQMVESDYQGAFKNLAARWRRRSLVVLFTDLTDTESSAELLDAIPILESLHRTVCVTVSDPNITEAAISMPDSTADVYRKAVSTQVMQERKQAITMLKRRGVWTIDSPPETLSSDLINHYLTLKARTAI
jgi:uncharacterized protein (DUF58 family)